MVLRCHRPPIPMGVHVHNDFGMATAGTVMAVFHGATMPHTCINGYGERAGNWEALEDFCLQAYHENDLDPDLEANLYYAHLKRGSVQKAALLLDRVRHYFPDRLLRLQAIQQENQGSPPLGAKIPRSKPVTHKVTPELICDECSERYPLAVVRQALERGAMRCACGKDLTRQARALLQLDEG